VSPYEQLAAMARHEAELVQDGLWDEVVALGQARDELVAELPETPPADAVQALAEAWLTVRSSTDVARAALAETVASLREVHEGQRALDAYARTA
jgi:hypothetical protein